MSKLANGYILLGVATVLWDGINNPDKTDGKDGKPITDVFSIEMAFPPEMPEYVNELWPEAQLIAAGANPRGVPANAGWGIHSVDANKIPECAGQLRMRANTYTNCPKVYDISGAELSAAQIRQSLYAGAKVRAIVQPAWFNADKNCGVKYWLDSIQIVDGSGSESAPRLAIASRGLSADTARSAFAASPVAGGVPVATAAQAAFTPPVTAVPPQPVAPAVAPSTPIPVTPNMGAVPGAAPLSVGHAPASAPGVPATSAPPVPTPPSAPTAPTSPSKQLTAQAAATAPGLSYDGWIAGGWTDEMMVQAGYLVIA